MLEDVLLIEDKHRQAAKRIFELRSDSVGEKKYIFSIGGESGSGKSEVANLLGKEFKREGIPAKIIHTDNYFKIHPKQRTEWRQEHGIESIGYNEYDWDMINQTIRAFKENDVITIPCIDLIPNEVDKLTTDFNGIQILILDGVYSVKAEANTRVFIDLTYHDTKMAQVLRGKEPVNEWRTSVLEQEHQAVQSLRPLANLIISKDYEVLEARHITD